ncbi:MAG: hypothetical protein IPI58_01635 [Alphaproteobacteria bacterium]|nr:MAG: hypothetical protein IPI58_01635 [Alphaproteobacteria bacterium]
MAEQESTNISVKPTEPAANPSIAQGENAAQEPTKEVNSEERAWYQKKRYWALFATVVFAGGYGLNRLFHDVQEKNQRKQDAINAAIDAKVRAALPGGDYEGCRKDPNMAVFYAKPGTKIYEDPNSNKATKWDIKPGQGIIVCNSADINIDGQNWLVAMSPRVNHFVKPEQLTLKYQDVAQPLDESVKQSLQEICKNPIGTAKIRDYAVQLIDRLDKHGESSRFRYTGPVMPINTRVDICKAAAEPGTGDEFFVVRDPKNPENAGYVYGRRITPDSTARPAVKEPTGGNPSDDDMRPKRGAMTGKATQLPVSAPK